MTFWNTLIENINILIEYITSSITNTIHLISITNQSVSSMISLAPLVPTFIYTSASIVLGVGVIKLVLGWGNV